MATKIIIEDEGEFYISNENVPELLQFLDDTDAIKGKSEKTQMQEVISKEFAGLELLRD